MKSIVLTGGGTAGHVFGCLALVPKLEKYFDKIYYIGTPNGIEKKLVENNLNITFIPIKTAKLVRKLTLKNVLLPLKLLKAIHDCNKILKKIKPSVIFSKGGFVSVPVTFAGHSQNIPIILHESDISLGLANKLAKNKAKVICTSFDIPAQNIKNGVCTGSPIRQELFLKDGSTKTMLGILDNQKVLLVIGGSLGASSLNELVWKSLDFLCEKFFVIHITGKGKQKNIKHKNYKQIEFCEHMQKLYSIANFAITRGGSNAIFELLSLKIPMIIAPLKKQTRGEQTLNAKYFCKKNYALMLEEESETELQNKINLLIQQEEKIKRNMNKYSQNNSTEIITQIIKRFA